MSRELIVQYVRFEVRPASRVYFFSVRETSCDPREYTLTILNEAFNSRLARFQDAADICSLRLHRELDAAPAQPERTHYSITDAELEDYRSSHSPKSPRGFYPRKPGSLNLAR